MSGVFLNEKLHNEVISKFSLISSVDHLGRLLNWIEKQDPNYEPASRPFDTQFLYYLAKTKESRYTHFSIEKKSGSIREIKSPDQQLKRAQRSLNCLLQIIFKSKVHYATNGFLFGRNIIRNAKPHVNKKYVLNCDIKDFFPSINFRRVKTVLELNPFNLSQEKEHIGFLIANLCTHENSLPQGAPTSPLLSNIVTQKLDRKLSKLSLDKGVKYSRYADDLTFSCNKNLLGDSFVSEISIVVTEENFQLNTKKTRLKTRMDRQQVTGLVVNEKVNVKREYLQKVRAMLNNWEKGGLEFAKRRFKKHQPPNKKEYNFIEVLSGHISFIGNVKGNDDNTFKKIKLQFGMLRNRIDYEFITHPAVKNKLIEDNLRMEKILHDKIHVTDDKFISFCTSAFHQVENLINYYYWRRFPNLSDLLEFLLLYNPGFKKQFKDIVTATNRVKSMKNLNINVLVYVFEKEFYIDSKDGFYDRRISKLREVRNDNSHRCSVHEFDRKKVITDNEDLQKRKEAFYKKEKRFLTLNTLENEIEFKFHLIEFLDTKDFYYARKITQEIALKIKKDLSKRFKATSKKLSRTSLAV